MSEDVYGTRQEIARLRALLQEQFVLTDKLLSVVEKTGKHTNDEYLQCRIATTHMDELYRRMRVALNIPWALESDNVLVSLIVTDMWAEAVAYQEKKKTKE